VYRIQARNSKAPRVLVDFDYSQSLSWLLRNPQILERGRKVSWLGRARQIAAWVVIPAFLVMFISEGWISAINPQGMGPWPDGLPRPRSFEIWLWMRNVSFLVALITGVFSLPRWQAFVGLILTLAWATYIYLAFSNY
jgi:hypothetical protein